MFFGSIVKYFKTHNMCVVGVKGSGKDLIFGNVIDRRKKVYASNLDYGGERLPLDFNKLLMGGNTYKNLINGDVKYYKSPYPLGCDVYLSDAGIYLPAQYCNEINKEYSGIAMNQSLTRQLNDSRFHVNAQSLNRVYDKIREQADFYILCRWCIYIPYINIVIQKITIYDKYESCVARVQPCRVRVPLVNKEAKIQADIYRDNHFNVHGTVKNHLLLYHNKSKHDSWYFRELFENGKK